MKTRKIAFYIAFMFGICGIFLAPQSLLAHGNVTYVNMFDGHYAPEELEIHQGDSVIFVNLGELGHWPASNIHPTHEIYSEFDPLEAIPPGGNWEFRFDEPGIWRMHDHIFPKIKGKIVVQEVEGYTIPDEPVSTKSWQSEEAPTEGADPIVNEQESVQSAGFWGLVKRFFSSIGEPFKVLSKVYHCFIIKSDDCNNADTKQANSNDIDDDKAPSPTKPPITSGPISENSETIFHNLQDLRAYIEQHGPTQATWRLHELSGKFGNCHDVAHEAGRISYDIHNTEAFTLCSAECHSGCYHGATEAYFRDHGTANIRDSLAVICNDSLNAFFGHQCLHGIGHGLTAWADYEIFDALDACDLLPEPGQQGSCYTGVFMENIVGGLAEEDGHFTEYLSEDPLYPCTIVEEKYKGACYFLQTSRMIQLYGTDFKKVADACLQAPESHQHSCFGSMGRDVGGNNSGNPEAMIAACQFAPEGPLRIACLNGAVQDTLWDPTGQDVALRFCKLLVDENEKHGCYNTIFGRAPQVLVGLSELESFCNKVELVYRDRCRQAANLDTE